MECSVHGQERILLEWRTFGWISIGEFCMYVQYAEESAIGSGLGGDGAVGPDNTYSLGAPGFSLLST